MSRVLPQSSRDIYYNQNEQIDMDFYTSYLICVLFFFISIIITIIFLMIFL